MNKIIVSTLVVILVVLVHCTESTNAQRENLQLAHGESIPAASLRQPSLIVRGRKAFFNLLDDSVSIIFPSIKTTLQNEQQLKGDVKDEGDGDISTTAYWVEAILVLLGAGVGFIECFFGYRIFKLMVTVIGFLAGSLITYFMAYFTCESVWGAHWYVTLVSVVAALIAGVICAWAAWYFYLMTVFCTGCCMCELVVLLCSLTIVVMIAITEDATIGNWKWVFFLAQIIIPILFGIIAVCLVKPLLIICTSIGGAYLMIDAVGFFAGNFPSIFFWNYDGETNEWSTWKLALYFVGIGILAILGIIFQAKFGGKQEPKDAEHVVVVYKSPEQQYGMNEYDTFNNKDHHHHTSVSTSKIEIV